MTRGYKLPAKLVIHTVGPVWRDGRHGEPELLASCYRRSLELATEKSCRTIAFPAISTGAYGFPLQEAAKVAISTVRSFSESPTSLTEVLFCCFSADDHVVYEELLASARKT